MGIASRTAHLYRPLLRVDVLGDGRRVVLAPRGELDIASTPAFATHLERALNGSHAETIVVDLSRLSFIDSSGLRILIDLQLRSEADGFRLLIVPGAPAVQRTFEICGLLDTLPFTDA